MPNVHSKSGIILFAIFFVVIILLLLRLLWVFLGAIVLALLTVNLTYPIYSRLEKLFRNKKSVAAYLMTSFVLLCIIVPVFFTILTISKETAYLYTKTKDVVSQDELSYLMNNDSLTGRFLNKLSELLGQDITPEYITQVTNNAIKSTIVYLYKEFNTILSNVARFILSFLVMIATIFTMYKRGDELKEYLLQVIPLPKHNIEIIVTKFNEIGRSILFINGLSGVIQGTLLAVSFLIVGLGAPVLWGAIAGFFAFMPIIGITLVYIPATAFLILKGKMLSAIFMFGFNIIHSSLVEYILKPRLIGKDIKMSGLLVFVGIIGGMQIFGVLGILYGPLIIALFISFAELYRLEYRRLFENGFRNHISD